MILKFHDFIKESTSDYIKMYRGDSEYIPEYEFDKFDTKALFGPGLYLTENRFIASTYTNKGDKSNVICEFTISDGKKKNAELKFIISYIMPKMFNISTENPKNIESLNDFYNYIFLNMYYTEEERYSGHFGEENRRLHNILKEKYYDKYIQAKNKYEKEKNRYKFILVKIYKDSEFDWEVINNEKYGHLSEFLVPKYMIDSCYDAEVKMNNNIIKILELVWNHYRKQDKKSLPTFKKDFKSSDNCFGIDTLGDYFFKNSFHTRKKWDIKTWKYFITLMEKEGYKGIKYSGGHYSGSPVKHNAYVFWDIKEIERIK